MRVKLLAVTMRALADARAPSSCPPRASAAATATTPRRHVAPLGGAVTGFTKALARERARRAGQGRRLRAEPHDGGARRPPVEETLRDPGAVEVGHADGLRWTVGLADQRPQARPGRELDADTRVRRHRARPGSIVSAITADLAGLRRHLPPARPVPEPDPGDPDLARFATDQDGLKRDLAERLRAARRARRRPSWSSASWRGSSAPRAALDRDRRHRARRAARRTSTRSTSPTRTPCAGVGAGPRSSGRIDVLMHAAGLEISHFLPDKPQREFDLVFDVKADGWLNLLHALRRQPLGAAVGFSSIAGRFGNAGQTDYAAANDLLCKSVSQLRRSGRRRARIAIDWTAWAGIGMATRGSIPKMMEAAGIDMLPPEVGVPVVRRELTAGGRGGEVVVAGALGVLLDERHADRRARRRRAGGAPGPMTGRVAALTLAAGSIVRTDARPDAPAVPARPPDRRHAGAARRDGHGGLRRGCPRAAPRLAGRGASRTSSFWRRSSSTATSRARWSSRALVRDGGDGTLVADCELIGRRTLPGQGEQRDAALHAAAPGWPARRPQRRRPPPVPTAHGDGASSHDDVYRVYFHGPAYQVLDRAWRDNGAVVGAARRAAARRPRAGRASTAFVPRLIELCFQTAGVWELGTDRAHGAADARRPRRALRRRRRAGCAVRGRHAARRRGRAWTPRSSTKPAACACGWRATARSSCPGGLDADALAPIRAAMDGG